MPRRRSRSATPEEDYDEFGRVIDKSRKEEPRKSSRGDRDRDRDRDRRRDRSRSGSRHRRERSRSGSRHRRDRSRSGSRHRRRSDRDDRYRRDRDKDRGRRRDRSRSGSRHRRRSDRSYDRDSSRRRHSEGSDDDGGNATQSTVILSKPKVAPPKEVPLEELTEEEQMARLMGFGNFNTTKNKKVKGNDTGAAVGAKAQASVRTYRQYMNRRGGFNRPLEKNAHGKRSA